MKTLKQVMNYYKEANTIQLIIGAHLISIDTNIEGSAAIIRAFEDKKFAEYSYNETHKHLILTY